MVLRAASNDFFLIRSGGVCRIALPDSIGSLSAVADAFRPNRLRSILKWYIAVALCRTPLSGAFFDHASQPSSRLGTWDWQGWLGHLQAKLGFSNLVPAYYFPPDAWRLRAGVLLLSTDGKPRGYAKVVWDDSGRVGLEREIRTLAEIAKDPPTTFRIPQLLHHGCWDGRSYGVFSPLPPREWVSLRRRRKLCQQLLLELRTRGATQKLSDTSWWPLAGGLTGPWCQLRRRVIQGEPRQGYPIGRTHGDFAPWNIRHTRHSVWLFDWEFASEEAPLAEDFLHFVLSRKVELCKQSPQRAIFDACSRAAKESLGKDELALALIFWKTVRSSGWTPTQVGWSPTQLDEMAMTFSQEI